jgi:pyruvate formate lyase activating enzyme
MAISKGLKQFRMQAAYFTSESGKVHCHLCPHHCLIKDGQTGICRVRRNVNGILQVETYGRLAAIHLDPIEKKPLYHFYPGSSILSVGSVGCNMRCKFCQNCDISQVGVNEFVALEEYTVDGLVQEAYSIKENIGIAFTYNEPSIFYEFMVDVAQASHLLGLKNVMVTNGFIETEPLQNLLPFIDAFNVDLKAFNDIFYRKLTNSHLEPVKQTLMLLRKAQKHFEITNLIIPGHNDSIEEFQQMINWIHDKLGKETILHLSKYFPRYQFTKAATPDSVLEHLYNIAIKKLDYVYVGNIDNHMPGHHTVCQSCGTILIKRSGYQIDVASLTKDGNCASCGSKAAIIV